MGSALGSLPGLAAGAAEGGRKACVSSIEEALKTARELAATNLAGAEACLVDAQAGHPKDRDLAFQLMRVRAWRGEHAKARAGLARWRPFDRATHELDGDLHWYAGDPVAAERAYRAAIAFGDEPVSVELRTKHEKAMNAEPPRAAGRAALEAQRFSHGGDDKALETRASASYEHAHWLVRTEAMSLRREFGDDSVSDTTVVVDAGRRWGPRQLTEISLGTAISDAEIVYEKMAALRHEAFVSEKIYVAAEARVSDHDIEVARLYALQVGAYAGHSHVLAKVFRSPDATATLVRWQHALGSFAPELWIAAGRAEALRPYLLGSGERTASFRAVGAKLGYAPARGLGLFVTGEGRDEETAYQRMWGGGLTWSF